jgi:PhnB protein
VRAIPEGYTAVTPWIISPDTDALGGFLESAFGATELARIHNPDGSIGHAEFRIGDAVVMAFDAHDGWPATPSFLRLYVVDGDAAFARALHAGAEPVTDMTDMFFGERVGRVRDPQGNIYWIHQRVEELDPDEMGRPAGQAEYTEAMGYVQRTLDDAMRARAGPR